MRQLFRTFLGRWVAFWYVITGARRRAVKLYDVPGAVLSMFAHNPGARVLEPVLAWMVGQGFTFLSTDELLEMVEGKRPWRARVAWLTFDDGWSTFEEVLPVLERWKVPATIFVAPQETERGQIWTNSVMGAVALEQLEAFYGEAPTVRYGHVDAVLEKIGNPRRLLSQGQLRRLAGHPLVTLENHTWTHLSCSHRSVSEVIEEVRRTQKVLTDWTGRVPRLCCYPFGHCTEETDRALVVEGLLPVHSEPGVMTLASMGRARNMCTDNMTASENIGRVLGAWPKVKVRTK